MSWIIKQHSIQSTGDIAQLEAYAKFLTNWHSFHHPAVLSVAQFQCQEQDSFFAVVLQHESIKDYQLGTTGLQSLVWTEKLMLVQQALDIQIQSQKHQLNFNPVLDHVLIHRSGLCAWLPPSPEKWLANSESTKAFPELAEGNTTHTLNALVELLLNVLGYTEINTSDWHQLEKQLPLAWSSFIQNLLADNKRFPDKLNNFRFLLYQAWLYLTANNLSFRDGLMTEQEYTVLDQLGQYLGLSEEQRRRLEVIAQIENCNQDELLLTSHYS